MNSMADIVHRGYESKDLDYKGPISWDQNDKAACCELVKDILAMANTNGGYIVIGVEENDKGFNPVGLSQQQLASFETTCLNQFVQRYVDPPINCHLVKHDGKFVVIEVPVFAETPHICVREYPDVLSAPTLYIRTDNNASAPLSSSADYRRLLAQAVRNSHDQLMEKLDTLLKGRAARDASPAEDLFAAQINDARRRFLEINPYRDKDYKAHIEFIFQPNAFVKQRFDTPDLRKAAEAAFEDFRGWPFLFISPSHPECTYNIADCLETLISFKTFSNGDMVDFWRLFKSGLFYQRKLVWEDTHDHVRKFGPVGKLLDLQYNVEYFAEAIHCLGKLCEHLLRPPDAVRFVVRFVGMNDRQLVKLGNKLSFRRGNGVAHDNVVTCERVISLAEWTADPVGLAVDMGSELCYMFNWNLPDEQHLQKICEDLINRRRQ